MSGELVRQEAAALEFVARPSPQVLEQVLAENRFENLTHPQRLQFLHAVCESLKINSLTSPFKFINLKGKLSMYGTRDLTDQLRKRDKVSIRIADRAHVGDVYMVTARAILPDGREDESIGALPVGNLKGEDLANALMKCETKAKRRVTLSICGLGFVPDESELDTVPHAPAERVEHVVERIKETAEATGQPIPASATEVIEESKTVKAERKEFEYAAMVAAISGMKERVGHEAYYRVLGANGYEHANEVRTRADGKRLYHALCQVLKDAEIAADVKE